MTEGGDNTPPPEQFVDYPAAQVETAGLTPPLLRHSNYTPHHSAPPPSMLLDAPFLEESFYHVADDDEKGDNGDNNGKNGDDEYIIPLY